MGQSFFFTHQLGIFLILTRQVDEDFFKTHQVGEGFFLPKNFHAPSWISNGAALPHRPIGFVS